MQANKSRDTKPELAVRRLVHALGLRYRVGIRPEPALRRTADLVFTRAKVAVFIDGCFWHGCNEHYVPSKTHTDYWRAKVAANTMRDKETNRILKSAGWIVLRFWAHENPEAVAAQVAVTVRRQSQTAMDIDGISPQI